MTIEIEIIGIPQPGGSKTAGRRKDGGSFVRPANRNTAVWRSDVMTQAAYQYSGELLAGPIQMDYEFRFPRPQHHYGSGKNSLTLKPNAPFWHTGKPDLTKIIRSTEDALTGIIWRDDAQVCNRTESKRYCNAGERPGVSMAIFEIQ